MMEIKPVAEIKLRGGPEQTVSRVFVGADDSVSFEFFDFSPMAQEHFGNDVAYTVIVSPGDRPALARALALSAGATNDALLDACGSCFQSYFDVQPFLEAHSIPFDKKFEPWA